MLFLVQNCHFWCKKCHFIWNVNWEIWSIYLMQKCELITDKSMILTIVSQMWHFLPFWAQKQFLSQNCNFLVKNLISDRNVNHRLQTDLYKIKQYADSKNVIFIDPSYFILVILAILGLKLSFLVQNYDFVWNVIMDIWSNRTLSKNVSWLQMYEWYWPYKMNFCIFGYLGAKNLIWGQHFNVELKLQIFC